MKITLDEKKSSILLIIGGLALAFAILLASTAPGNGEFDVDIYSAYPPVFWGLLILALLCGFWALIRAVFIGERPYSWVPGFLLAAVVNFFVLALPFLRDYAFTSYADSVAHFSRAANIILRGQPDGFNIYPAIHQLAAMFSLFTGMELEAAVVLLPALFYIVYLINVLLFTYILKLEPEKQGMVLGFALPLVYGTYSTIFRPTHLAVYMLPLFLAALYKAKGYEKENLFGDRILFLLVIIFLILLHPLAVVAAILLIVLMALASFYSVYDPKYRLTNLWNPLLLIIILELFWISTFYTFFRVIRELINSFYLGITTNQPFSRYVTVAQRAQLSLRTIFELFFINYGAALVYLFPIGIVLIWVLVQLFRHDRRIPTYRLAFLGFSIIFTLAAILSQFRNLFSSNPLRFINFVVIIVPFLIADLFINLLSKNDWRAKFVRAGLLGVLILAAVLGIFSAYNSVLAGRPSLQFTYSEQAGFRFLVDNAGSDEVAIYTIFGKGFSLYSVRPADLVVDMKQSSPTWNFLSPPPHFGYDLENPTDAFTNPGYLVITPYTHAYYTQVWPEEGSYTRDDFERLEQDHAWNKIYTAQGMVIWRWSGHAYDPQGEKYE